jgi:carbon monoxide dehydrogenase subunit G
MLILESVPDSRLLIQLEFIRPFKASNRTTFTLSPEGEETLVKWSMDGRNALLSKVLGLFVNMDRLVGADFERGLSNLNQVVASAPLKS